MVIMAPFSLWSAASGFWFLVRPHLAQLREPSAPVEEPPRGWLRVMAPIGTVVAAALVLPPLLERFWPGLATASSKMVGLLVGLIIALVPLLAGPNRHEKPGPFSSLLTRKSANVLGTLAGVMVFKSFLGSSGLLPMAGEQMLDSGIPLVTVTAALPFVAGLVTGIAVGFAGTALPLVAGLTESGASGLSPLAALVLAFGFGYAGMMLSPVHLCLVVTREYFASSYRSVYRLILPCVAALLVASVLGHLALSRLGI
jgi:hypothetical protein